MSIIDKLIDLQKRRLEIKREIELAKLDKICKHEWEISETINVVNDYNDTIPTATKYLMRCKHCGELKNHRI